MVKGHRQVKITFKKEGMVSIGEKILNSKSSTLHRETRFRAIFKSKTKIDVEFFRLLFVYLV